MVPTRRQFLLTLSGALATTTTTGCLDSAGGSVTNETTSQTATSETSNGTTSDTTTQTAARTTYVDWVDEAEATADTDKSVRLANVDGNPHTVRVRVFRVSKEETIFDETYDLDGDESRGEVFNTQQLDGPGNVAYRVLVTMGERSAEMTFETDDCHGGADIRIVGGALRIRTAIC